MRRRLFVLGLGALVAWTAASAAIEIRRAAWHARHDPAPATAPSTWTVGSRHALRLERFLDAAGPRIEPGASLAVSSKLGGENLFLALWVAYLLPGVEVRLDPVPADAAYRLVWGAEREAGGVGRVGPDERVGQVGQVGRVGRVGRVGPGGPGFEAVYRSGDGVLYRRQPGDS